MEPIVGDALEPSFSCREEEKLEGIDDLLEECWFFGNLLNINTSNNIMSMCYSDPCPSSSIFTTDPEILAKISSHKIENSSSAKKLLNEGHSLTRAPSLPSYVGKEKEIQEKERKSRLSKLTRQTSLQNKLEKPTQLMTSAVKKGLQEKGRNNAKMSKSEAQPSSSGLLRSPSLPPCIGREEEIPDEESYARLSNLIRQALPSTPDISPRRHTSKGMIQSSSSPRSRPPRNLEAETIDTNSAKETKHQSLNQSRLRRTMTSLEFDEVQGFKEVSFTFEKDDLLQCTANKIAGLQEKKKNQKDLDQQDKMMRLVRRQSCSPPIPNRLVKQPSAEDMKVQIKFWARAVACNVRQEC